jgi:hypothetical protein
MVILNRINLCLTFLYIPLFPIGENFKSSIVIEREEKIEVVKVVEVIEEESNLLEAMIQVESRGNEAAVGDTHMDVPSIGVLQIRPIMVKEVNRILGKEVYTLKDRASREKSIEMFEVWKNHHHKNSSDEKIARCWNGGPLGYKYSGTDHYWAKVQSEMQVSR